MTRSDLPRKSKSRIHAAEGFRPLQAIKGVESVRKIETGLECDQRLPRKLRITVPCDRMRGSQREHNKSQFSQQPLTPFEPRFVFPDRLDMHQRLQRPKTFCRVNHTLRFRSGPSSGCTVHENSKSQFSQQPLVAFEPRFVFPDRLDMPKRPRWPKTFRRVNRTLRF